MIKVWLAGPVRGKGRPRFVKATGHAFTDGKTVNYEAALRLAAQEAMEGQPPLTGPCVLKATAYFPVPAGFSKRKRETALAWGLRPTTKPDGDNILKLTDALNGVCFVDDKQIVHAEIDKYYAETPGLLIRVEEWPSTPEVW